MTKAPKKTKKIQRGLGRGLSTLLGDAEARSSLKEIPVSNSKFGDKFTNMAGSKPLSNSSSVQNIPIEWINPGPWQPRRTFDNDSLKELAKSLVKQGVIQPILIRPTPNTVNKYQLIAGERRWRAAQIAKIYEIPAVIREFSEQEAAQIALVENVQRRDLSSIEEATAYSQLIQTYGYTQHELSELIGKSRSHIANLMRLLKLPDWIQSQIENGSVSVGQIRPIIGHADIDNLAKLIIKQGLTAREAENLLKRNNKTSGRQTTEDAVSHLENKDLEEKIERQIGLKTEIKWNPKREAGAVRISVSSLEQFDALLEKLGVQTR
ncbi:MAG: ParB/RepB/Spo0J family partition protein [Alphaproteobacteria bacterium]|nr:ParB/RepB/Spo0J family partition protein [Alphaproteobacteria bacterium]